MTKRSLYGETVQGYEIPPGFSSNIDTDDEWQQVETRISTLAEQAVSQR